MTENTKVCTVCGKEKPLYMFGTRKYRENNRCKACHAKYMRHYRAIKKNEKRGLELLHEFLKEKGIESEEE